MERIARLVVHIEEAIRLSEDPTDPYQRLSLLLFDSAAELMLHRETQYRLAWMRISRRSLDSIYEIEERLGQLPAELEGSKEHFERSVVSERREASIERDFNAKVAYLQDGGLLDQPTLRVLQKLHRYRNEAYHRDILRPATLATAVRIYRYVVCVLLRELPLHVIGSTGTTPEVLTKYFPDGKVFGLNVHRVVGEQLVESSGLETTIAAELADHLTDRIAGIREALQYAAQFLADLHDDGWDVEAVLHLVQIGDPRLSAAQARESSVAIGISRLDRWQSRAASGSSEPDAIEAFRRFADIEDEVEPLEERVFELVSSIDNAIQDEIDRARGK